MLKPKTFYFCCGQLSFWRQVGWLAERPLTPYDAAQQLRLSEGTTLSLLISGRS